MGTKTPAVSGPWGTGWDEEPGDSAISGRERLNQNLGLFSRPSLPRLSHRWLTGMHVGPPNVGQYLLVVTLENLAMLFLFQSHCPNFLKINFGHHI